VCSCVDRDLRQQPSSSAATAPRLLGSPAMTRGSKGTVSTLWASYDNFFGYCCDGMPSYGFYDLSTGTIGQVRHDRMRIAAWPVSTMQWFFPLE